ncbi:alpha/beta-hydrolase [Paraphaeosphaeria sporulosa]|uniref:Alpha/beta-hydrolase n=1 Tax=Paraphaeosphaeria sporulosa TaxID=1460663 RepID=A0A177CD39_9PLEO|nr:alpha/beta-hydrolase [Paraphaeosphaeria sporulosa]OAG04688.1 alpha/beta-hydrolase [Paraphaeosphaeria sporulosa]
MATMPPVDASAKESTIQLTTRNDRSVLMFLLHMLLRPFHNHVGRPGHARPEGSVELKPSPVGTKSSNVTHRVVCDMHVYDIVAKQPIPSDTKKRICYFGGGGWQTPPSSQHWGMCSRMAQVVPGATVSLVSYPLAPKNPAQNAFPWLMRFYREIMDTAEEEDEKIILAGDSSGGNIVLALVLEALREDDEDMGVETKRAPHPLAIFAICPSTDLTRNNPDIEKTAKHDPFLTPKFIKSTAKAWCGDMDPTDRRVSPINADISLLKKYGIHVHGITAGHDILSPDGILLRKKLEQNRVTGQWLHWEKQMHCFVLTYPYGLREAKEAMDWVGNVLKDE